MSMNMGKHDENMRKPKVFCFEAVKRWNFGVEYWVKKIYSA